MALFWKKNWGGFWRFSAKKGALSDLELLSTLYFSRILNFFLKRKYGIKLDSSYEYTVGDYPLEITGIENFNCGFCESHVTMYTKVESEDNWVQGDTDYIKMESQ